MRKLKVPLRYRFICWIDSFHSKTIDKEFKTYRSVSSFHETLLYSGRYVDVECEPLIL